MVWIIDILLYMIIGKDDKFWAGHYGTQMSTAIVRVKSQVNTDDTDQYEDVISDMVS